MKGKLLILFLFFTIFSFSQESKLGFNAGYVMAASRITINSEKDASSDGGVYFGILGDLSSSENLRFFIGANYMDIQNVDFLQIPILAKIYPSSKSGFNPQAGIQITHTLTEPNPGFGAFNFGAILGLGYDFNTNLFLDLRYSLQLNNYFTDSNYDSGKAKINFLSLGLGVKF